jgi:FKBP-type peptidyl-prolyl cis-trans isomerase
MKNLCVLLFFGVLVLFGCRGKDAAESGSASGSGAATGPATGSPDDGTGYALDKDASYALGMDVASSFKQNSVRPDYDAFTQGFKDILQDRKARFTEDEARGKLQEAFLAIMEKQNESLRQAEIDFLAENSKKAGITVTASGLQYEVVTEGTGAKPGPDDMVQVNYEGTLTNGTVFDSSFARGEPVEFPLSGVIPGWTEGLQLMGEGARYRFVIPSDLAYGPQGNSSIPPYSPLIFEVELIAIIP